MCAREWVLGLQRLPAGRETSGCWVVARSQLYSRQGPHRPEPLSSTARSLPLGCPAGEPRWEVHCEEASHPQLHEVPGGMWGKDSKPTLPGLTSPPPAAHFATPEGLWGLPCRSVLEAAGPQLPHGPVGVDPRPADFREGSGHRAALPSYLATMPGSLSRRPRARSGECHFWASSGWFPDSLASPFLPEKEVWAPWEVGPRPSQVRGSACPQEERVHGGHRAERAGLECWQPWSPPGRQPLPSTPLLQPTPLPPASPSWPHWCG